MTDKFTIEMGVEIIQTNLLPQQIMNKKTGEMEIIHMIQKGNALYVSKKLYDSLQEREERKYDYEKIYCSREL